MAVRLAVLHVPRVGFVNSLKSIGEKGNTRERGGDPLTHRDKMRLWTATCVFLHCHALFQLIKFTLGLSRSATQEGIRGQKESNTCRIQVVVRGHALCLLHRDCARCSHKREQTVQEESRHDEIRKGMKWGTRLGMSRAEGRRRKRRALGWTSIVPLWSQHPGSQSFHNHLGAGTAWIIGRSELQWPKAKNTLLVWVRAIQALILWIRLATLLP